MRRKQLAEKAGMPVELVDGRTCTATRRFAASWAGSRDPLTENACATPSRGSKPETL